MLVAVGDVEGVEVFQGTSLIRQPHSGDAFQDLIQLLLTRGLKRAKKAENKQNHQGNGMTHSINTLDSRNTSKDEHLRAPPQDTGLPLGPAADCTCRHPKPCPHMPRWGDIHISPMCFMWPRANTTPGHRPWRHRGGDASEMLPWVPLVVTSDVKQD